MGLEQSYIRHPMQLHIEKAEVNLRLTYVVEDSVCVSCMYICEFGMLIIGN